MHLNLFWPHSKVVDAIHYHSRWCLLGLLLLCCYFLYNELQWMRWDQTHFFFHHYYKFCSCDTIMQYTIANHLHFASLLFTNMFANHIFQLCSSLMGETSTTTPCRTRLVNEQSRKMWFTDSSIKRQNGQQFITANFLDYKLSKEGMYLLANF